MATSTQDVLLVSLEPPFPFEDMYADLLTAISSKASIIEGTTSTAVLQVLSDTEKLASLAGVLVTDTGVTQKKHKNVAAKLVEYARAGGVVIFGFTLPTFIRPLDANLFFSSQLGLDWKFGSYHREVFRLSKAMTRFVGLKEYSMKAVQLKDVPPASRLYVSGQDANQSAVAFEQVGTGYLGWIGDVNTEEGSTRLVLAMCNL